MPNAQMEDHALLSVFVNQTKQVKMTSARITWDSGQQVIFTLGGGFAGFSPGSGQCSFEGGFVIPVGGLETDYVEILTEGQYVDLQLPIGAKTYAGRGKIVTCDIGQDTGNPTAGNFQWQGQLAKLQ
ncbi:MAG: hypothetical protein AAF715_31615 [Myxococcota bacterium]